MADNRQGGHQSGDQSEIASLRPAANSVIFGARFANSAQFMAFFESGMGLVERAADYLDGEGRSASRQLPRETSMLYASESMRLTTRLMQVASWLLLQRAVNDGEMSRDQARDEKAKVSLDTLEPNFNDPYYDELPEGLKALIEDSVELQRRAQTLDANMDEGAHVQDAGENAVHDQLSQLRGVFGA